MKKFKNENVSKEYNKTKNILYIGLFIVVLAIIFIVYAALKDEEKEAVSLLEMNMTGDVSGEEAYIDIATEPVNFAYYEGDAAEFYLVYEWNEEKEESYLFVVKMSDENYEKLVSATEENPIRITGTTVTVPSDIKQLAIDALNEINETDEFTISDFDNYFGTVYLDLEKTAMSTSEVIIVFAVIGGLVGLILMIAGGINTHRFQKNIKNLNEEEFAKIEAEMEDKDAFYYKNARTYLTKNYIINFNGAFTAIPYQNIIWVYKYEYRQNGLKTQQNIRIMTKDGKTHVVANLTGLTKKAKDVFDEILETIVKNSPNALIGYTKENKDKVKEKIEKP